MGFLEVVALILCLAKLFAGYDISWWVVFSPILLELVMWTGVVMFFGLPWGRKL